MRIEQIDQPCDLVAQGEPPLLEAPKKQFVLRHDVAESIDGGIEVGMLDAQLDQLAGK